MNSTELLNNYFIFDAVPDFDNYNFYIFIKKYSNRKVILFCCPLKKIIDSEKIKDLPGKELINEEIFNSFEINPHGIEWTQTNGFALGLDTLFENRIK